MKLPRPVQDAVGVAATGAAAGAGWLAQANEVLQLVATVVAIVVGGITLYNHLYNHVIKHKRK